MKIINNIAELRASLQSIQSIAFVPTMGNLHEGHLALVRKAKAVANCVVVSIYVNPLQFLPNEDFKQYPRTLDADCALLKDLDVDIVFTPNDKILFPVKQEILVLLPSIADQYEGAFRPGFFRGVSTIVLKLLNIIQPDFAIFGKKDYQQLHIVRGMVQQFNLPVNILDEAIVRAADGLALSSRNQYLNATQRAEASHLYHNLNAIETAIRTGQTDYSRLTENAANALKARGWTVDYIAALNQSTLMPALAQDMAIVIVAAARIGQIRLIDNIEINLS